ncbi:MAG: SDR family oxidoreductase, partial [Gluconacetobacter diazotrophicus]|nr:SDR family oxidoreductase [Gluconacetobacter diazotrophicus]
MPTPLQPAAADDPEIPPAGTRLQGRVVVLFGGGSVGPGWGNGKAAAVAYAREGATVVAIDRDPDAVGETARIIAALGGTCTALTADVTDGAAVKAVVDQAVAAHGRIDVLHNNVGTTIMGGPIELTEEQWDTVLAVNLRSAFLTAKHVLPVMIAQGKGAIVNISSMAAIRYTGYPYGAYYAAKAGVNQLTVGIAIQHAKQGIRANAIMPGLMNTPLIYQQIGGQYADLDAMVQARHDACPMGR